MTGKRLKAGSLIGLALFCLFNANFNLLDIFPDCIAYLILWYLIKDAADSVPYLDECKTALKRLAIITALKIPSFFVMYKNLYTGRDIVPMFSLIFVATELVLLYSVIANGYKALSYIGERTDASVTLDPFPINRREKKMTPSALLIMTVMFFLSKGILTLIPDMMMLTPGNIYKSRELAEAFPIAVVICMLAVTVIGLIWMHYTRKYVKALKKTDAVAKAIDSLKRTETENEENN